MAPRPKRWDPIVFQGARKVTGPMGRAVGWCGAPTTAGGVTTIRGFGGLFFVSCYKKDVLLDSLYVETWTAVLEPGVREAEWVASTLMSAVVPLYVFTSLDFSPYL